MVAAATGAQIYLSGEGGEDWTYGFEGVLLKDLDTINLGNITITARHTPALEQSGTTHISGPEHFLLGRGVAKNIIDPDTGEIIA